MNIYARHAAGVRAVQNRDGADCPVITWAGKNYKVTPASVRTSKDLDAGGFKLQADLTFIICADLLPSEPQLKQTVTYLDRSFQIQAVHKLAGETLLRIECNDPNNES